MKSEELFQFLDGAVKEIGATGPEPAFSSLEPEYLSSLALTVLDSPKTDAEKLKYLFLMQVPLRPAYLKIQKSNPRSAEYIQRFCSARAGIDHFTYAKIPGELWSDLLKDFLKIHRDYAARGQAPAFDGPELSELRARVNAREAELIAKGYDQLDQDWMAK
jgi:hypothetical protein